MTLGCFFHMPWLCLGEGPALPPQTSKLILQASEATLKKAAFGRRLPKLPYMNWTLFVLQNTTWRLHIPSQLFSPP